jgi:hypothetical protein
MKFLVGKLKLTNPILEEHVKEAEDEVLQVKFQSLAF